MIPSRKYFDAKSPASSRAGLPSRLRRTSHQASDPRATTPTAMRTTTASPPSCQTRIPSTTPPMPTAERIAPTTSTPRDPVYGHVVDEPAACEHDRDDHDLAEERDPPGQVRRDEAADERPDRGGDRRRGADQRVGPPLHRAREVAVDQRLHRRQQQRRAEPADDRPEDDDRREGSATASSTALRPRSRAGRGCRRACGRSGRRSCCRSG